MKLLKKLKFRIQLLSRNEIILLTILLFGIWAPGTLFKENLIILTFVFCYVIPVSTFGNNFSNIPFLVLWIIGCIWLGAKFDWMFTIELLYVVFLYLVSKVIFVMCYEKDLVLGSTSGYLFPNNWYSSESKSDGSKGDYRDKNVQMILIFVAVLTLLVGGAKELF